MVHAYDELLINTPYLATLLILTSVKTPKDGSASVDQQGSSGDMMYSMQQYAYSHRYTVTVQCSFHRI